MCVQSFLVHNISSSLRSTLAVVTCFCFYLYKVCEDQNCEDQVFPLAVNFLDRFLCTCGISRRQLQLVAAVCLLLASKIRQWHALSVDLLCLYTDHSISPEEMKVRRLKVCS